MSVSLNNWMPEGEFGLLCLFEVQGGRGGVCRREKQCRVMMGMAVVCRYEVERVGQRWGVDWGF